MSDCRVYHIDQDDNVYLIAEVESDREAHEMVVALQALGDQGLLPETFYVHAPCGSCSDVDWMLRSLRSGESSVDYMAAYYQALEEKRQASIEERQSKLKAITTRGRKSSFYGNL